MQEIDTSNVVKLQPASGEGERLLNELQIRAHAELERRQLSHALAAKEIGVPRGTLTNWLSGSAKYSREIVDKIEAWLDEGAGNHDAVAFGGLPKGPRYCKTPTGQRIINTLAYCHAYGDLGCIYGAAGVGKTKAANEYRAKSKDNVFIMTGSPEISGVHPMLEELARAVGLQDCLGGSRTISRSIRATLKSARQPLLIIDEAQHLNLSALESLRSIHDETEAGLVLMGNPIIYERVTGGTRSAHFAQLHSRMGAQLRLRKPAPRDVAALLGAWKLTDDKSSDYLAQVAKRPGALRNLVKVLRLAIAAAGGDVRKVRLENVRFAARNLGLDVVT